MNNRWIIRLIITIGLIATIGCGRSTKQFIKDPFVTENTMNMQGAKELSKIDYFKNGKEHFKNGEFKSALNEFESALKEIPNSSELYYNLGLTYYELHNFSEAIKNYSKAIELKKDFSESYFNLGVTYYQIEQYEKSLQAYEKAMKYGIDDAPIHFNIGLNFLKLLRMGDAKREFSKALEIEPRIAEAYNNLGYIAEAEGDSAKAKEMYNKALSIKGNYILARKNLDCLTIGSITPKVLETKKAPEKGLYIDFTGKWRMNKDIILVDTDNSEFDAAQSDQQGIFRIGYQFSNWFGLFMDVGLTNLKFKDDEVFANIFDKNITNFEKDYNYKGFEKVIGPTGGIGINLNLYHFKWLKLGFDSEIEFQLGSHEDEMKVNNGSNTNSDKLKNATANVDWREYNLLLRANYFGFKPFVPYIGGMYSKLDGKFELNNVFNNKTLSIDYDEADPFSILIGASYYLTEHLRFQADTRFVSETSVTMGLRYSF